jgi:hypothetical protein
MRRSKAVQPLKRSGIWYLMRRVPREFQHLDNRVIVRISTEIAIVDDPKGVRAKEVVRVLNNQLEAYWRGMRDGQAVEARIRFDAAQARAAALNLSYKPALEITDIDDLLRRVAILVKEGAVDRQTEVAAVLGGEDRPRIRLSNLVEEFEAVQQSALRQKSPRQLHKWRLQKLRAVENLRTVLEEDKAIEDLTRDDAIRFRLWWEGRLVAEGLDIGTANKDIGHVNKMLTTFDVYKQLHLKPSAPHLKRPSCRR